MRLKGAELTDAVEWPLRRKPLLNRRPSRDDEPGSAVLGGGLRVRVRRRSARALPTARPPSQRYNEP